jgi:PhnB protein
MSYKPDGYSAVSPYLIVNGANETIAFLTQAFDAVEIRRFPGESGGVMHAEVRIQDSVIMMGDSAENWPAVPAHIHIYVPDVDAYYQRALAAGAESVQEPAQQPDDEDKRGGVKDAGGTTWWIATKVS